MEKEIYSRILILRHLQKLLDENIEDEKTYGDYKATISVLSHVWGIDLENAPYWASGELVDYIPEAPSDDSIVEYYMLEGNREFGRGYFDHALQLVSKAVEISGGRTDVLLKRADILMKSSKYEEAISDLNKCIESGITNSFFYVKLGFCFWALGKSNEARKAYNDGLKLFPDDPTLRQSLYFLGPETQKRIPDILAMIEKKKDSEEFKKLLEDEEIASMVEEIEKDPQATIKFSQSLNFMKLMSVLVDN